MSDRDSNSQLSQQLSAIQEQLNQFAYRFENIETQLKELSPLSKQLSQLEDKFLLVADSYRYETLQKYLADRNWFEADKETIRLILDVMGKEIEELTPEDIEHFPCKDLMTIDGLWLRYSNNRFGFSPQLKVYQKVGGDVQATIEEDRQLVEKWGEILGWRKEGRWLPCNELDFSLNAPQGCHPSRWWNSPYGSKMTNFFLRRLISCDIFSQ